MSAKHQTPEYRRNAKTIRERVHAAHRRGEPVPCWRCGAGITIGTPFDVGHLPNAAGSSLHELAPEHRHKTGACRGNRNHGAAIGARITNGRRAAPTIKGTATTWQV